MVINMKKILCYGDSNTYGFNPSNFGRYSENKRWSGILKQSLATEFEVIECGLNNRTGFVDNPAGFEYSSQKHFPKLMDSFERVDIIILAVGTNDLQYLFDLEIKEVKEKLEKLINIAKTKTDKIILIPSVKLDKRILKGFFNSQFDKKSIEKSLKMEEIYKAAAKETSCEIFDINEFAKPSDTDGLHYTAEAHKAIAEALIKKYFANISQ